MFNNKLDNLARYFFTFLLMAMMSLPSFSNCPEKILNQGTIKGTFVGLECSDMCHATFELKDGKRFTLLINENEARKHFGKGVGQKATVNYEVRQFWHEGANECLRLAEATSIKPFTPNTKKQVKSEKNLEQTDNIVKQKSSPIWKILLGIVIVVLIFIVLALILLWQKLKETDPFFSGFDKFCSYISGVGFLLLLISLSLSKTPSELINSVCFELGIILPSFAYTAFVSYKNTASLKEFALNITLKVIQSTLFTIIWIPKKLWAFLDRFGGTSSTNTANRSNKIFKARVRLPNAIEGFSNIYEEVTVQARSSLAATQLLEAQYGKGNVGSVYEVK